MPLRSVATKTLSDQRRSLSAWVIGVVVLVLMYAALWPTVRDAPGYRDLMNQMPESLRAMFTGGVLTDLGTPEGYVYVELLSFMGPMIVLIYTITAGAAAVAGEEDRHTMDLLLVNPVSRARVVVEKFAAMVAGTAVLMVAMWLSLLLLGSAFGMHLSVGRTAAAMTHLGLLGVEFGTVALLIGSATGRVALARAVPAFLAVAAYVVNALAPMVGFFDDIKVVSPFYQYIGQDPIRQGFALDSLAVALVSTAILLALAVGLFDRRDVAA
jgi:ABC-2 type transport system permease protein